MNRVMLLVITAGALTTSAAGSDDAQRAYQAELNADAQARTSMLADKAKAGGFTIADGDSKLTVGGWTQFRYYMNWRDNPGDGNPHDSGFTNGFEATRTRLVFSGNVLNPNLKFKIESEFGRSDGNFSLKDAYGSYKLENGIGIKWGQYKLPLLREELVSDTKQLTVERSVENAVFNQSRSQGVEVNYVGDGWRAMFDVSDGLKSLNTPYYGTGESDVALTGRFDWKWGGGDWGRFDDFTSWRGADYAGMHGIALHWQHNGDTAAFTSSGTPAQQSQYDLIEWTTDISLEGNGWNAYAAFIHRHLDPNDGGGDSKDDFGAVVQAGFFVSDEAEIFGRWDAVFPDSNYGSGNDQDFNTATFGMNWYFVPESHAAKFTTDFLWFFDTVNDDVLVRNITPNNTIGLLPDANDNQILVRFQMQLMF